MTLGLNLDSLVVLKSTVLPNHLREIEDSIKRFVYNPEFLREKHANEDFISSPLIVKGLLPDNAANDLRFKCRLFCLSCSSLISGL